MYEKYKWTKKCIFVFVFLNDWKPYPCQKHGIRTLENIFLADWKKVKMQFEFVGLHLEIVATSSYFRFSVIFVKIAFKSRQYVPFLTIATRNVVLLTTRLFIIHMPVSIQKLFKTIKMCVSCDQAKSVFSRN